MSAPGAGTEPAAALDRALAGIRRRWRLRRVLEGTALGAAVVLLGALGAVVVMDQSLFAPGAVASARSGFYVLASLVLLVLVLAPALWRIPNRAVARYVESRAPELDALLLSAVETRDAPDPQSPGLARRLLDRAAHACRVSPRVAALDRRRSRRAGAAAAGVVALAAALVTLGPDGWRHGAWLLVHATQDPAAAPGPYSIRVAPGDVSVLAGEDVRIAATPDGFRPEALVLASRAEGGATWARTPLTPSPENGGFETYLFDVSASVDYRIEHPSLRSATHRIEVIPRPVAERIDLRYEYPEYTGRAPELVSGGGDIAAVRGTRVEVRVTPSTPTREGRLMVNGERGIPLRPADDGTLRAPIELTGDGHYRVELEAAGYGMAPASPEYAIVARVDSLPSVELVRPGRDTRVTSIEEIAVEARAEDDVAVRALDLVLSINGGPDEVVPLAGGVDPRPTVAGRHELFLEERDLAPGDLIAYYVRARDAAGEPARQVSSDIFFMDVRPFEMSYRRARGGGGGGGGGQQRQETLAAQQRSLVVALFKLLRDRGGMDEPVVADKTDTLATAQTRIRTRVDAIVRRLSARRIIERNPAYRRMAEELPRASKSMLQVEALLAAEDLEEALPPARQALLHLQRADSAFREAQVAQSQQGGGGGGSAAENDLANLFRLEMDRFRSPYEDVQRGDWRSPGQRVDEALRKLRELAERQQREIERAGQPGSGTDGDRQRAIAEELDKLVRELERLTRKQPSEALRASLDRLQQAARAMRRAAGGSDARAGGEALDRMREARRLLDSASSGRLAREINEARRRAEAMAGEQSEIEREVARSARGEEFADPALADRKRALADRVEEMESRLDRLAAGAAGAAGDRQADAAEALERAADALRKAEVAERIRRSAQPNAAADEERLAEEGALRRALRELGERIASAGARITESGDERLSLIHEEMRAAMRELERRGERLADRARRGPALSGGEDGGSVDLADARSALTQQAGGVGGLAEALARQPGFDGDLATLLSAIEATREEDGGDAASLARQHAALLAALQGVERELRERLGEEPPAAWGRERAEAPPARRDDVEAYYRNLSESAAR